MIRLGPFDLVEPVGKGGMGEIWSAVHRGNGIDAAVKVLTVSRAVDFGFRAAFRKEVRAVAGLDHPNVVMVFDHGEVTDEAAADSGGKLVASSPYLAMEFVSGGSLADRRGSMPWPQLRQTLLDLLGALAHAHSRGVIHRDIKPGNALVLADGTVKLTDFGLAHAMIQGDADRVDAARRGGTPAYMAPEQLQGAWRDFGPWTDLYALGCLAWSMVTGRPPFVGPNWLEVMRAHLTERPPALQNVVPVPPEVEDWLRKLLAKHPNQRFRRAADAAWALLRIPEQAPSLPPQPAPQAHSHELGGNLSARTTLFWTVDDEVGITPVHDAVPEEPELDHLRFPMPPVPRDWRRLELGRSEPLHGAGLGLFGLRRIAVVGRERERDLLWSRLRAVESTGRGHRVWIHGPVGCGKTRLASWLCERAHEVGAAQVLACTHSSVPGPGSGLPRMIAHSLGTVAMAAEAAEERIRAQLQRDGSADEYEIKALTHFVAPGPGRVRLASPRERYLLLTRYLTRLCQERPLVLWLDDVHWGSDALGLAEHLAQYAPELPILAVLTSRDDGQFGAILGRARALVGPTGDDLPLGLLEPVFASALVRDLLGLRGELADQVEKRAAGNPLFAVQLVGDWVRRGILVPAERGFKLVDGATAHLPDDLHEVWSEALQPVLERSPAGARVTLELAAALGQRLDRDEWRALCKVGRAPAPESVVDLCLESGLLRSADGGWEFSHAMLRESLERTAREKGRWARQNLACAKMLRAVAPDADNLAGRLGRHLLVAGKAPEAMQLLLRGVKVHTEASEYSEALELLDRRDNALAGLGATDEDPRRLEGWLLRAQVYLLQGRPHLAEVWAKRTVAATRQPEFGSLHAHAMLRLADVYHHRGEVDQAERRYLAALKQFRAHEDWESVGDCLRGLGHLADRRGRFDRARELLEEARAAYTHVQAPLSMAHCIDGLARSYRKMGILGPARSMAEEALDLYERLGSSTGVATALRRLAVLDAIAGDYPASAARLHRALSLYERIGDPLGQSYCFNSLAENARFEGDLERAETGYRRALEIGLAIGTSDRLIPLLNLALVVLGQHRFEEARALLEDAAEQLERDGRRALLGGTHIGLVATSAASGDLTAMELHFRLGRTLITETGMVDPDAAWPAELAGDLLRERGERDWATACYEVALAQWRALGRGEDEDRVRSRLKQVGP